MQTSPLMPKATAVWLIRNTSLTFEQIAEFCSLHMLEIKALADGSPSSIVAPFDPIAHGQLTQEEIDRCQQDENSRLILLSYRIPVPTRKKYTPLARRQDKPDAISWLIKNYPHIDDISICKLISTTKSTVNSIRNKTHKYSKIIKPKNPVTLGLCSESDIRKALG
jgi:uncharacterized protein